MTTRDERIEAMATAVRDADPCGAWIDGVPVFCDDERIDSAVRAEECLCKLNAAIGYDALLAMGAIAERSGGPDGYVARIIAEQKD
jgi:hypothetical protein